MKKTIILVVVALSFIGSLSAQLKVGVAGSNPNASAILELESTSKGFLPPRLTDAQRDAILSPPAGLLIYNTTSNALEVCDGTNWVNLATEGTTARTGGTPSGNGGAGLGNSSPVAQAKLQLSSTSKGFLPPRLTSAQRDAIASPPAGLLIYNTTDKRLEYANGSHWIDLAGSNITTINSAAAPAGKGDMGIGTTNPHVHASLEIESTTQGFLLPTMSSVQIESIVAPSEGLMIFNTSNGAIAYYNGSAWVYKQGDFWEIATGPNQGTIAAGPCQGSLSTINHDGYVYKPIVSNGRCWLNNNLGASYANPNHPSYDPDQQATSNSDKAGKGHLFQWGRAADGHETVNRSTGDPANPTLTSNTASTYVPNAGNPWDGKFIAVSASPVDWLNPQVDTLWQVANGNINNPCPNGYHVPTEAEWDSERATWNSYGGPVSSPLAVPNTGQRRESNGSVAYPDLFGTYWSSSINGKDARALLFSGTGTDHRWFNYKRASGYSVRCIKD